MAQMTTPAHFPPQALASMSTCSCVNSKNEVASDNDTDASSHSIGDMDERAASIDGESDVEHARVDRGYQTDDDFHHPVYYMPIPPHASSHNFCAMLPVSPQTVMMPMLYPASPCIMGASPPVAKSMSPMGDQLGSVQARGPKLKKGKQEPPHRTPKAKVSLAVPQSATKPGKKSVVSPVVSPVVSVAELGYSDRTTVMLKNLPKGLSRSMLLELLEKTGFLNRCNFVYLPLEFTRRSSMGYAFVNLESPATLAELWSVFDGLCDWPISSSKVCNVIWSSPLQGLAAHIERFRNSPLMHTTVPDECQPILLNNGLRVEFPAPTKALRVPRPRASRSSRPFWQVEAADADTES